MPLFSLGKKKPAQPAAAPAGPAAGVPTDLVIQMRQQGFSNNQIMQNLQGQGYSSSQIFDAMNQADIKGAVEAAPPGAGPALQEAPPAPAPYGPPPEASAPAAPEAGAERIEEVVESIIDEKWDELMKSVDKIVVWKDATDAKLIKMAQAIKDLKNYIKAY